MILAALAAAALAAGAMDQPVTPVARHLDLGKEEFQRGNYGGAFDAFVWVLERAPENIEAKTYLTRIGEAWQQRLNGADLSSEEREQALRDAVRLIAAKKKRLAELDAQLDEIKRALERGASDPEGLLHASRSLSRLQDAELGERILADQSQRYLATLQKELRSAISSNATFKNPKDIFLVRGYLWYYKGHLDAALREWERALALAPEDGMLREQIAWASKKKALLERGKTIQELLARAQEQIRRRNFEQAVLDWHSLVILEPQNDQYQKALADAEQQWRKAKADKKLAQGENNLLQGRITEASRQLLEAVEIDPTNTRALEQLKLIQNDLNQRVARSARPAPSPAAGERKTPEALESSKKVAEEQYTLGLIYYSQGELEKARKALLTARDYDPGNEKAKTALDRVLAELNP